MTQVQKRQSSNPEKEEHDEAIEIIEEDAEAKRLDKETQSILDEIDALLEEDAERFVTRYVQRGGQ